MANRIPPPPPGGLPVYQGGPPQDQPRGQFQPQQGFPQQGFQQPAFQQQGYQQQPGLQQQVPGMQRPVPRTVQVFNESSKISDITPQVVLSEEFCRRELTWYEVWTLRKAEDGENKKKEEKDKKKDRKSSKSSSKPKLSWLRVRMDKETYDQDVIAKRIQALNKNGSTITTKKAILRPNQSLQVTTLLDDKNGLEYNTPFTWTLTQLDRKEVLNKERKRKETEVLTLYLKRSLKPNVSALITYQNIENAKFQQNRPLPQMNEVRQYNGRPQYEHGQSQGQPQPRGPPPQAPQQRPPPPPPGNRLPAGVHVVHDEVKNMGPVKNGNKFGGRVNKNEIVEVIHHGQNSRSRSRSQSRSRRSSIRKDSRVRGKGRQSQGNGRRSSSDSDSESTSQSSSDGDSDSEVYTTDTDSGTDPSSVSSGNRRRTHRYPLTGKSRKQHEKGYVMLESPSRRLPNSYVPDPPLSRRAQSYERPGPGGIGIDPAVTEAFVAGVVASNRAANQLPARSPRAITYNDDRSQHSSQRSLDGDSRVADDFRTREELRLQEEIRGLREELRPRNVRPLEHPRLSLRDDPRPLEFSRLARDTRDDYFGIRDEYPRPRDDFMKPRDDFIRARDDFPSREELRLRSELRHTEDAFRRDTLPSPRTREQEFFRRGSLSPLPLENDRGFEYVPNPFHPHRRASRPSNGWER